MMKPRNVKIVTAADGRYTILARIDEDFPWVPVEVCPLLHFAKLLAEELEWDEEKRRSYIEDSD